MGRSTCTVSGRPDGKIEGITSINGQNGLICFAIPNAKTPTYKHLEEVKRNLVDGYIENGVEIVKAVGNLVSGGNQTLGHYRVLKSELGLPSNYTVSSYSTNGILMNIIGQVAYITAIESYSTDTYIRVSVSNYGVLTDFTSMVLCEYKKSPYLATQGTTTHTDLIGSPSNYPTSLKSVLASGKGVGFMNALLTSDNGDNLIPDGTSKDFKLSKKLNNYGATFFSTGGVYNTGLRWASDAYFDRVSNGHIYTMPATQIAIVSYTAQNQSAVSITTPKPIEVVDRDLIASNHHSVYAYNGLTYAGTGKVATGSSVDSKGVEDVVDYYINITRAEGVFDLISGDYILRTKDCTAGILNEIYLYTGTSVYSVSASFLSFNTTYYFPQGQYKEVKHATITLDNQSIVGAKALVTQTASATQVFTQEMIWDYDLDAEVNFTLITSTDTNITITAIGDKFRVINTTNNSIHTIEATLSSGTTRLRYLQPFDGYWIDDNGVKWFREWDGNGFGDTNKFDQLTSGTDIDLNGNTIKTSILYKPSSIRI